MQESFFSRLKEQLEEKLPFVVYRKPEESAVLAVLQKNAFTHNIKDYTESGFVFSPFDDHREALLIPLDHSEVLELENFRFSTKPETDDSLNISYGKEASKSDLVGHKAHLQLIEKAVVRLKAGLLEKVVLSRKENVNLTKKEPLRIFMDLLRDYPNAFVYCWYHPNTGPWLGATPETLLKLDGFKFKTMALAGTQKFTGTTEVNWGEKEQQEQKYVTDAILENLEELKLTENLHISDTFTSRAGGLLHLRTDITGRLRSGESLGNLIRTLHPTPAVCGLPRDKAKSFINEEEDHDREYYTGFLGELNFQEKITRSRNRRNTENLAYSAVRKRTALYVNLRCMKLEENKAVIFVGGGITKDSVPEDEYMETVNKAGTMKKVLGRYIDQSPDL